MRALLLIAFAYLGLGTLGPVIHHLEATRFVPDVTMALVVYAALNLRLLPGAAAVAGIGLLKDATMGGGVLGLHTEVHVLVFLLVEVLLRRTRLSSKLGLLFTTLGAILVGDLLFLIFSVVFDAQFAGARLVAVALIPRLLVSAPLVPLILAGVRALDRRFFRQETRIFFER